MLTSFQAQSPNRIGEATSPVVDIATELKTCRSETDLVDQIKFLKPVSAGWCGAGTGGGALASMRGQTSLSQMPGQSLTCRD